jgi:hypothetical protein
MSFDIARTPTLEAVANADEQILAQDLQKRVAESLRAAERQPEVVEAAESQRVAAERLEKLRTSQRALNEYAKDARERHAKNSQAAIDTIIESAATLEKLEKLDKLGNRGNPDFQKLAELATDENHNRYASRALEQIAEHLIPLAQIANLRGESHALLAKGRVIERMAQQRAEKVLLRLKDAVTDEMVLPVDLSKGVVGALLAQADGLKRRAVQISESADEFERSYADRQTRKEGRV